MVKARECQECGNVEILSIQKILSQTDPKILLVIELGHKMKKGNIMKKK